MSKEAQIINTDNQPAEFKFNFDYPVARLAVKAFDADQPKHVYYFRYLHHPEQSVEIRFPVTPKNLCIEFVTDNPISIANTIKGPLTQRNISPEYDPAPEVKRSFGITDVKIAWVDTLGKQTPAKICVEGPDAGTIYLSRAAEACIPQQQWAFIVNHEFQHVNFDDEAKTDHAAFYEYMRQGYNISQAFRALVDILGRNPENVKRMIEMFRLCQNFNEHFS